ncbi:hypothetical protein [Leptospira tipperaryensis]|uniref:hypothetical protein n=1 Tax=Leptospira tipperaryensis TaxID=2564040 RepID=UPI0012EA234E|nr:hypothetical protein [Leptospira tipperaryensis]
MKDEEGFVEALLATLYEHDYADKEAQKNTTYAKAMEEILEILKKRKCIPSSEEER